MSEPAADNGMPEVSIIGMGHVGLPLAIAFADAGLSVRGVDVVPGRLDQLAAGRGIPPEPGIVDRLKRHLRDRRLTLSDQLAPCPAHVICVGTEIDAATGQTRREDLLAAAEAVASVLRDGDLVVLRSTVTIGATRQLIAPVLAAAPGTALVAACPERSLEGAALAEIGTLPQIVGGLTGAAGDRAEALFNRISPRVLRVAEPEAAEIAKLANNTLRDITFAFANEIAAICEAAGADVADVVRATSDGYSRAGLARPGPVGGPCLSKDPLILAESARGLGRGARLAEISRQINVGLPAQALGTISDAFPAGAKVQRIVVAGLAFKGRPEVADLRATPAAELIAGLQMAFPGAQVVGYDPLVTAGSAKRDLGILTAPDLNTAAWRADIVVFQTDHQSFAQLDLGALAEGMRRGGMIYDFWAQFPARALPNGIRYTALGRCGPSMSE